jgi:hypothetical protein
MNIKLIKCEQQVGYRFVLTFESGEVRNVDLENLIGHFVDDNTLHTANINAEWGCLEFKGGIIDIEPNTLYQYALIEDKIKII